MATRKHIPAGSVFGKLTVLGPTEARYLGSTQSVVRCECGAVRDVPNDRLRAGTQVSCGCWGKSVRTKHGAYKTKLYSVWQAMRRRCENQTDPGYPNYGGRGITVCDRWQEFENFRADIGERPSKSHSLDRINNDGPYAPWNVRWATRTEQARNTSKNRLITYQGQTRCTEGWDMEFGVPAATIRARLFRGWDEVRAITTPVGKWTRRTTIAECDARLTQIRILSSEGKSP